MVSKIGTPVQVLADAVLQGILPEKPGFAVGRDGIEQQAAQGAAQPFVGRKIEPHFLAAQGGIGQFSPHEFPQHDLLRLAADFQLIRQRSREFHNPMVEERRPDLDRVRHAHAVHFGQDIVCLLYTSRCV